jgi:hypothetical protein
MMVMATAAVCGVAFTHCHSVGFELVVGYAPGTA